ncbi:MAG: LAGLIDADG family homing endonuclease, partial [Thaumarchaeota archaeon]|nr:LAGLIDADG family homing endonuclease [Nitrososphaerota archaeon]
MSEASQEGRLVWPPTKEDLERLYLNQKLSAAKIAKAYGLKYKNAKVAESTVLYELKKNGIKRRDRADHSRKVTEAMVDEWVGRYRAGESLKQIAGEGLSPVSVFLHLRKRGLQLRDKVEAQIQAVTKHERRPFDGSETDRAYLVGFTKGDCQTIRHGRAIRVRTSTTHPGMEILFDDLFGRFGLVHRYPRKSKLTGYEWSLEVDLHPSFGFLLQSIEEAMREFGRSAATFFSFLSGFLDAEGTIYFHRKGKGGAFEVSFANSNVKILIWIQRLLAEVGLHSSTYTFDQKENRFGYGEHGTISRLCIFRAEDVVRLLGLMRVRHSEKIAKA